MTETDLTRAPRTAADIRSWLIERVAHYLEKPAAEIDPEASLTEHGLDSVYAFALCGDIEDELGVVIEPPQLWDVDSVTALTAHLVGLAD